MQKEVGSKKMNKTALELEKWIEPLEPDERFLISANEGMLHRLWSTRRPLSGDKKTLTVCVMSSLPLLSKWKMPFIGEAVGKCLSSDTTKKRMSGTARIEERLLMR